MKKLFFIGFLFFLIFSGITFAGSFYIYIYNKPFHSFYIFKNGEIYAPAAKLAQALNLELQKQKNEYVIGTPPEKDLKGRIILNGKLFLGTISRKGILYVPLKTFAQESGNKFLYNRVTGIIQILPGSSPVTSKVASSLAKNAFFAASSSLLRSKGDSSHSSFYQQVEALQEKYRKILRARTDLLPYFSQMENWGMQRHQITVQLNIKLHQAQAIQNKLLRSDRFANIAKGYADQMQALQRSFDQILPPSEFQKSHRVMRLFIDSTFPKIVYLSLDMERVFLEMGKSKPAQYKEGMQILSEITHQLSLYEAQSNQAQNEYFHLLQNELENVSP